MSSMKAQEDIFFKRNVFTIQVLRVMCLLKNSLTFRSYYIGHCFSILKWHEVKIYVYDMCSFKVLQYFVLKGM